MGVPLFCFYLFDLINDSCYSILSSIFHVLHVIYIYYLHRDDGEALCTGEVLCDGAVL